MKAIFSSFSDLSEDPRAALLFVTLGTLCEKMVPEVFSEVVSGAVDPKAADIPALLQNGALRGPDRGAASVFARLSADTAALRGRNILISPRALTDELRDFGAVHGLEGNDWPRHVLANYDEVIFLDRFDFARSVGLAPWIHMELSDRFPLCLAARPEPGRRPRILVIDHSDVSAEGAAPDVIAEFSEVPAARSKGKKRKNNKRHSSDRAPNTAEEHRRLATDLGAVADVTQLPATGSAEALMRMADAEIHLHLNYSNHRRAVLSPFDSILGPRYTIIVPECRGDRSLAGDELGGLIAARAYAREVGTLREARELAEDIARHVDVLTRSGLPVNPEMQRAKRDNDELLATRVSRLKELVTP